MGSRREGEKKSIEEGTIDLSLPQGYVSLIASDEKAVIIPVAVALRSRLLQSILTCAAIWKDSNNYMREEQGEVLPQPSQSVSTTCSSHKRGEESRWMFDPARFPNTAGALQVDGVASSGVLTIPLRCVSSEALVRVAEFLVNQTALTTSGHVHETEVDVLGDLSKTSEKDQLMALEMLLASDFLGC